MAIQQKDVEITLYVLIAETHLSPSSTTHKSPRVQLQQTSLTSQQTSPVTSPVNRSETNSNDMEKSTEVNHPDLETHNALTSSTENLIDKNNHNKKKKVIDTTIPKGKKPNIPFTDRSSKTPVSPINQKQITLTASQVEIHSVPQSKTNINNDSPNMDKSTNSSVLSSPKSTQKPSIKHSTEESKAHKIHQITTTSNQPSTRLKNNNNNNKPKNSNQNFKPAHRRSNIPIPKIPNKNISTST
ncbi:putative uncharacterized protein DDB_G0277255 [Macrobrachium rosenbergii]|uniref:putative uncharacterized protein DDB_G0277255 n=1 Tax=Macrobrachium rosenbergii TaxID=79674 RepID=UPI0034D45DFF